MAKKSAKLTCPKHLTGEAKREWVRVMKLLPDLQHVDRGALAVYCAAWGTLVEAEAMIKADGLVVTTHHGNKIPNPAVGVRNTSMRILARLAGELHLTPRSRRNTTPPESDNGFASELE